MAVSPPSRPIASACWVDGLAAAFVATVINHSDDDMTPMEGMFFTGWFALLRTTVVGILAYAALVVFLRCSGKRTLAKMNALDLIVTVSLGSTLATIALSADVALAQGLLALALARRCGKES